MAAEDRRGRYLAVRGAVGSLQSWLRRQPPDAQAAMSKPATVGG